MRWPARNHLPDNLSFPFGVLVFLRQSVRSEQGTWTEASNSLHCYIVPRNGPVLPFEGEKRALLIRGLFCAAVRTKPEEAPDLASRLLEHETALTRELRRLDADDAERRVRHAVLPLFAGIVSEPA